MPGQYQSLADQYADQYGIPRSIFSALISKETTGDPSSPSTAWNPYAFGTSGEIGLTQLMPQTAAQLGVSNAWDPDQNLNGGASYLSQLFAKYKDWTQALSAYNAGDPTSTAGLAYAKSILGAVGPVAAAGAQGTEATATTAPADSGGVLGSIATWLGTLLAKDANAVGTSIDPNSNPGSLGDVAATVAKAAPGSLAAVEGGLSNVAKYAIVGFVAVAALGLGMYALTQYTKRAAVPLARTAVT